LYRGIDVSHNNGTVDWAAVKAGGIDFAIIRAGYGQLEDRNFKSNMEGAAQVGLPVGIYYFSYAINTVKAAEEAAHCCTLIKPYKIELPVFFDFEYDSETFGQKKGVTYTKALRTAICKAFCERVRAGGYTPGIYTNVDYITNRLNWQELTVYPLWLAQWPLGANRSISYDEISGSSVNTSYGKPMIWQIGYGKVSGIRTETDLNYCFLPMPRLPVPAEATAAFLPGDKVRVINTKSVGVKRAKLYNSDKTFVVYRNEYDVISVSGKRVVIGVGKTVTAAVNADDLRKI
jgi:lysozyme